MITKKDPNLKTYLNKAYELYVHQGDYRPYKGCIGSEKFLFVVP